MIDILTFFIFGENFNDQSKINQLAQNERLLSFINNLCLLITLKPLKLTQKKTEFWLDKLISLNKTKLLSILPKIFEKILN